jgi:hypothetical protein
MTVGHFEGLAERRVPQLLQEWLGTSVDVRKVGEDEGDFVVEVGDNRFVIEVKSSDEVAAIDRAWRARPSVAKGQGADVRVLAVPYMGPKARVYARAREMSWLDLSGNADIRAPGVRILIGGMSNRFARRGRPSTVFSPRAARVSRAMLVEPDRWWFQKELAEATQLSRGYVSKLVRRMLDDELVAMEQDRVRPRSASVLLDAWAQEHDFTRQDVRRFHVASRSGRDVLSVVAERFGAPGAPRWAATGLGAAWLWTQHADFRLATFYVEEPLHDPEELGLRPVDRGENVWIAVPRDGGVFYHAKRKRGVLCVHPVQVYLDLLGHPERAKEAASQLRSELLSWKR